MQLNYTIVGRSVSFHLTLKCLQTPVGAGSKDFSTLKMIFIFVLVLFARECLKNGLVSVALSPSMPLSTNVDSALLSLIIDSAGFYCKREKTHC